MDGGTAYRIASANSLHWETKTRYARSETIATWLHRQCQLRKQIRDNKKTSLITHFQSEGTLLEADRRFHGKLLAARRGTRGQLDTMITNEEPPD